LFSLFGHCGWFNFQLCSAHVSTFLLPFAPSALPDFYATMKVLTAVRPALRTLSHHEHRTCLVQLSLLNTYELPMIPSPTTQPLPPSLWHAPSAFAGSPHRGNLGFARSQQARQTVRPNRVRHPMGSSFTSDCSPHRLATTQLSLVTGRRASARGGLAPPCSYARVSARCHGHL
jgi:hypothetical protein